MLIKLLFLFTLIPLIEIYVMFQAHDLLGLIPTIAFVLLTGASGAYLARTQGLDLLVGIRRELEQGRMPATELMDGMFVLAGGLLLLTPGFCTDFAGFLALIPQTRAPMREFLSRYLQKRIAEGTLIIRRF